MTKDHSTNISAKLTDPIDPGWDLGLDILKRLSEWFWCAARDENHYWSLKKEGNWAWDVPTWRQNEWEPQKEKEVLEEGPLRQ